MRVFAVILLSLLFQWEQLWPSISALEACSGDSSQTHCDCCSNEASCHCFADESEHSEPVPLTLLPESLKAPQIALFETAIPRPPGVPPTGRTHLRLPGGIGPTGFPGVRPSVAFCSLIM